MAAEQRKSEAKGKRKSAKGTFHRVYNVLLKEIDNGVETYVLDSLLKDLEEKYQKVEEKHELFLEVLESDNEADTIVEDGLSKDMTNMYNEVIKARKLVYGIHTKVDTKTELGAEKMREKTLVQIKKLDAPTFSGNIRDYPTFKKDYKYHMSSRYGNDPFVLKKCLSGDAEVTVRGVEDSFTEMFKRLDDEYGRPEKLVDCVMSELRKITYVPDGNAAKFIAMVETVEKCWLDLSKMSLQSEMDTAVMVSQVEKLLPPLQ